MWLLSDKFKESTKNLECILSPTVGKDFNDLITGNKLLIRVKQLVRYSTTTFLTAAAVSNCRKAYPTFITELIHCGDINFIQENTGDSWQCGHLNCTEISCYAFGNSLFSEPTVCHKHKLAGMVHVGHVLQLFGCSLNPRTNAYKLKSVITVQVFSIPFFSSEQFVQCASRMNLLAYLPYNIPEASFKLFNLHTST